MGAQPSCRARPAVPVRLLALMGAVGLVGLAGCGIQPPVETGAELRAERYRAPEVAERDARATPEERFSALGRVREQGALHAIFADGTEIWASGPDLRVDAARDERSYADASVGLHTTCRREGYWRCAPADDATAETFAIAYGALLELPDLTTAVRLGRATFTDAELAGRPARCVTIAAGPTRGERRFCADVATGVLLLQFDADGERPALTAQAADTQVDESHFAPPA